MDQQLAKQVFEKLAERGNDMGALAKQFNSLDKAGQEEFVQKASEVVGVSAEATIDEQMAQRAQASGGSARVIPDTEAMPTMGQQVKEGVVKPAVEALPIAGAMIGGTVGAASAAVPTFGAGAPGGAVVGAATGGAAGAALENMVKSVMWPEEAAQTPLQVLGVLAKGAVSGAEVEVGGQLIGGAGNLGVGLIKAAGARLTPIAENLLRPVAGAAAGAAVGGYLGGKKGAYAGGAFGLLAGVNGVRKISTMLEDDAAIATPRVSAKVAQDIENNARLSGRALGDTVEEIDKVIIKNQSLSETYPGATTNRIYKTAGELKTEIKFAAESEARKAKIAQPKRYYNRISRELETRFPDNDQIIDGKMLQRTASEINESADSFKLNGRHTETSKALTRVARGLRDTLDNYAIKAGDAELAERFTQQKAAFSELAKQRTSVRPELTKIKTAAVRQRGIDQATRVLSYGPKVLGPAAYQQLANAARRGMSALMTTYAHMLYNNPKFRELISSLQNRMLPGQGQPLPAQGPSDQQVSP